MNFSGVVIDFDGEVLIGVNILVKGILIGMIIDIDGVYVLEVLGDVVL